VFGVLALAVAALELLRVHRTLSTPEPGVLNVYDEGYLMAFAARLLDGRSLPFVDAVSHRGPLLYWVAELAVALLGRDSFRAMRWLTTGTSLLTAAFSYALAARAGRPFAGGVAALGIVAVLILAMPPKDGLAFNGELLLDVFVLGALLAVQHALAKGRSRRASLVALFGAGLGFGCAVASKQVAVVNLLACLPWVVLVAPRRAIGAPRALAALLLGVLSPLLVITLVYASAGALTQLRYWTFTYNSQIYMAPLGPERRYVALVRAFFDHIELWLIAVPVVGTALARLLRSGCTLPALATTHEREGVEHCVLLGAIFGYAAALAPLRDFSHYYIQALPHAALVFGFLIDRVLRPWGAPRRAALLAALVVVPSACVLHVGWTIRWPAMLTNAEIVLRRTPSRFPMCGLVAERSAPNDAIFVWGFDPSFYTACRRRPASRFVFTTLVAGHVPWIEQTAEEERKLVVPGSVQRLIADLEAERPKLVLDSAQTLRGRGLDRQPELLAWVRERYCPLGMHFGMPVWQRHDGASCDSLSSPRAAPP
jgi:hypothetical protein